MKVQLSCSCGAVKGVALNATHQSGNRIVCCCNDCQEFANLLERDSDVLDEFGGTNIYQTSLSQVKIETGTEHIRCLRLTPKGLYRWYTGCCRTPIANTMSASVPFIGVIHNFMRIEGSHDHALGPVRAHVQTKHARGTPTYPNAAEKFPIGITLRIMRKILIWKIKGMNKPSAFFTESGDPIIKPRIVN